MRTNDNDPGNGSGQFICRVGVQRSGVPLNASFSGAATLTIANKNTPDPLVEPLKMLTIDFSQDRCSVSLVNLPPIMRTFERFGIRNTATITRVNGGTGAFDRNSGRIDIPITLRIANSNPVGGISDFSLTLSTAAPGGRPLSKGNLTLVVSGTVSPTP